MKPLTNLSENELQLIKEIETHAHGTLKALHGSIGLDFNNAYYTLDKIDKSMSMKAIIKKVNILPTELGVMLVKYFDRYGDKVTGEFKVIVFNADGQINIGVKTSWINSRALGEYYRKSDFEDARKQDDFIAYVFVINSKDLKCSFSDFDNRSYNKYEYRQEYKKEIEKQVYNKYDVRFNMQDAQLRNVSNERGMSTCYGYNYIKPFNYNIKLDLYLNYNSILHGNEPALKANDIIDKSGYNVYIKRSELKQKANKLRADRKLQEAQKTDYSTKNQAIATRIDRIKLNLVNALNNCSLNSDAYSAILNSLDKLKYINQSYYTHIEKLNYMFTGNKNSSSWYAYGNKEQVFNTINELNKKLDEIEL